MTLALPKFDLFSPGIKVETGLISDVLAKGYPEELGSIGEPTPERAAEFIAGRVFARKALSGFGAAEIPIVSGLDRLPDWPQGFVGSITHKKNMCAVAVARSSKFLSLGIDLEFCEERDVKLVEQVCTESEVAWLRKVPFAEQHYFVNVFMSAKEAIYKMQFPISGDEDLSFSDVEVLIFQERREFEGRFRRKSGTMFEAGSTVCGRFDLVNHWVSTGLSLQRP